MKTLKAINTGTLLITAILYITVYYGLLFQIVLGFTQVISSLIIGLKLKSMDVKNQKRLKGYWLLVLIYFLLWFFPWKEIINTPNDTLLYIIGIILIPMSIAIYFCLILINIKTLNHETH